MGAALLGLSGCSPQTAGGAGTPKADSSGRIVVRVNEKKGDKWQYMYTMTTLADPRGTKDKEILKEIPVFSHVEVAGTVDMEVVDVKDKVTTYKTVNKVSKSVGKGAFKEQADGMVGQPAQTQEYKWTDRMAYSDKDVLLDIMTNCLNGILPEKAIKVGDSWEYNPFHVPDDKPKPKATYVADEKLAGFDAMKLDVVNPETVPGETNTFSVWIDKAKGRFLQFKMHLKSNQKGFISETNFLQTVAK